MYYTVVPGKKVGVWQSWDFLPEHEVISGASSDSLIYPLESFSPAAKSFSSNKSKSAIFKAT
jgi:hypothetical protein